MAATTITGADLVSEARRLIGAKFLAGGLDPATGLDHFGLLACMALRQGLVDKATLDRLLLRNMKVDNVAEEMVVTLRRCVVFRRLATPISLGRIQVGDFATFIVPDRETAGLRMAAEPVVVITGLRPLTGISVWPDIGVIEGTLNYELHQAFRLRKSAKLGCEASIRAEHIEEVQKLTFAAKRFQIWARISAATSALMERENEQ